MIALCNGVILTGEQTLTDKMVLINDGLIVDIVNASTPLDKDVSKIDLKGQYLAPGFIDLQLNGCGGVMFNHQPTKNTLRHMQQTNLLTGTTSFLPTLISDSDETIKAAIKACSEDMQAHQNQVLGMHLEGPYTNPIRKGIHPKEQLRQPSTAMINWLSKQTPWLKKVTLAPEVNRQEHIQALAQAGIIVSIGHSAASYDQAMQGFASGINFATHLYNAMTPTANGREPGVVGAIYDSQDVYAGIIADGYHVHWANVRLAKKILGERLVLVTDATAAASAPESMTEFDFCGATVFIKDGLCVDENGTLGGSSLTMDQGIRQLCHHLALPLDEAVRMATLYPAKALNIEDKLGLIKPGWVANLVQFDHNVKITATWVNGRQSLGSTEP
ncbi:MULTISPECIES: N-acetylglucosamine-6-phosphate deacetylase [unclassified Vibrio]|uniref:N-acetylglucosamine-6-phosphate deacetylase n=1 Tax=Vibrio sp. HB236076 TaxID=3232307 RepID=A0AB39HCI2_9VIBR|nr:N-acetylglucosamine-6-phosphate deacetylase [Vibrio sp. HB161653]MDP5253862.1 N-acetylglucosamine-6-phosphate deacetylase [Vibrio sp. HB161653]